LPCFLLLFINLGTGWLYYLDENNVYHRGFLYDYYSIYFSGLLVILLIILIINRKKLSKRELISSIGYIVIPSICLIIQMFYYGVYLSQFASALLLLVVVFLGLQKEITNYLQREKEVQEVSDRIVISQIQPHFLYNCISAIMAIDGNPKPTKEALGKFAKFLRFNLDSLSSSEPIPFDKEIEHVKNYVDLENLRMDNKLKVSYDLSYTSFSLPSLTIEMLVENSIKHGFSKKGNKGNIKISSYLKDEVIHIDVEDDGSGFDVKKASEEEGHYGLKNLTRRVELVGGSLLISSVPNKGTKVSILFLRRKGV
jgi:two-component system LytT family sensor kinase